MAPPNADARGHYAVQVMNLPPTEIVCKCGERFVGGDVIAKHKAHMDALCGRKYAFVDPIREMVCELHIPPDGRVFPSPGEPKIGIAHPGCEDLADLSIELDAFYCPTCHWNGRVSGAWCVDMIEAQR